MNNLDELARQEDTLVTQVLLFEGLKSKQIEDAGIYGVYSHIYERYVEIYRDEHNIEALKRALFLQWYAVSEPSYLTGLSLLDDQAQYDVLQFLNQYLDQSVIDEELSWMVQWYFQISDWYFNNRLEHMRETHCLRAYLQSIRGQTSLWKQANLSVEPMKNRGQMSDYWISLIQSTPKSP